MHPLLQIRLECIELLFAPITMPRAQVPERRLRTPCHVCFAQVFLCLWHCCTGEHAGEPTPGPSGHGELPVFGMAKVHFHKGERAARWTWGRGFHPEGLYGWWQAEEATGGLEQGDGGTPSCVHPWRAKGGLESQSLGERSTREMQGSDA